MQTITSPERSFFDSELTQNVRDKLLHDFLVIAPITSGSDKEGNIISTPQNIFWCNPTLLNEGYSFVRHNFAVVMAAVATSMWFGLSGKAVTGLQYKRYYPENRGGSVFLETLHKNWVWLTQNILDEDGTAFKQTAFVNKLHKLFAEPSEQPEIPPNGLQFPPEYNKLIEAIKEDMKNVNISVAPKKYQAWDSPIHFSQMNLALVQFGAIAMLFLHPKFSGLRKTQGARLQGYFHIWAVIGSMLGLEDRFNLALSPDRELFTTIFTNVALSNIKLADESVIFLWDYIASKIPLVSLKSLLFVAFKAVDVQGICIWETMNWKDKCSYFLITLGKWMIYHCSLIRVLANWGMWLLLSLLFWSKGKSSSRI